MRSFVRVAIFSAAGIFAFHLSLLTSSSSVNDSEMQEIRAAIEVLEAKGFDREVFVLRNLTTFRGTDSWFNELVPRESAYASTNYPFGVVTVYPDFFEKTEDDVERAMILLHEAQHLQGADESGAYSFVWRNRKRLGWTVLAYGTTKTFVTIELLTRENAPELFGCGERLWSDCTEAPRARKL